METCERGGFAYPHMRLYHQARYSNVIDSVHERANCKQHVFTLKEGIIDISPVSNMS